MTKSNIVLIGLPGSGKSTAGVLLAKAACMDFIDTDLIIQNKEKTTLQKLIDSKGIDNFIRLEEKYLCTLNVINSVISTGGSAIYSKKAMRHLSQNGTVIYLKLSLESIKERIDNIDTRGIVIRRGTTLEDMYNERLPYYERYANVVLECDGKTVEETVGELLQIVKTI